MKEINQIHLYSRDWGDGQDRVATIAKNGDDYTLAYNNDVTDKWYNVIVGMPDTSRVYGTDDVRKLFYRIIPPQDSDTVKYFLDEFGVPEYDEWKLLTTMILHKNPKRDCTGYLWWGIDA
jgi:hypothetical protein